MEDEGRHKKVEAGREKVSKFGLITQTYLNVRHYTYVYFFMFFNFLDASLCYYPQFHLL
jgi:hypothetical protein